MKILISLILITLLTGRVFSSEKYCLDVVFVDISKTNLPYKQVILVPRIYVSGGIKIKQDLLDDPKTLKFLFPTLNLKEGEEGKIDTRDSKAIGMFASATYTSSSITSDGALKVHLGVSYLIEGSPDLHQSSIETTLSPRLDAP